MDRAGPAFAAVGGSSGVPEGREVDQTANGRFGWERMPVHVAARRRAEGAPAAPAIWHAGAETTHGELAERAGAIAAELRRRGVGAEDLMGILISRSPEQVAAVLGVLMAGAAFLPLDPAHPRERREYMLRDSGATTVLVSGEDHDGVPRDVPVLDIGGVAADERTENHPAAARPDQLAYVIYTSGTTGHPKGVELTHGGLANVISSSCRDFDLDRSSRVLQFAPLSFDAAVWEILMALVSGGTLCLAPPDPAATGQTVDAMIRDSGATVVFLPPALLSTIDPATVPGVRIVVTGGDRVPAELCKRWCARVRLVVGYGPTEGTIGQAWQECTAPPADPPPIGRPIAEVTLHVLDHQCGPVSPGAVGEVHIGGVAVGRGYRHRPALTAERFVADPFSSRPGARMYRTGDLVRVGPDGSMTFVARADQQVKVRGFRIELGEVESALLDVDGVRGAVAATEPAASGLLRLVGYVVADEPLECGARVRARLRTHLPEHMVPSVVHVLPRFPLTATGKIDRRSLPAAARTAADEVRAGALARVEAMSDDEARAVLAGPPATSCADAGERGARSIHSDP